MGQIHGLRYIWNRLTGQNDPPRKVKKQAPAQPQRKNTPAQTARDRTQVRSAQGRATASLSLEGNSDVESMARAIRSFPGSQASATEATQIAEAVQNAAREFNLDPKLLLATLAHESHFDVNANNGNGKGLGQITQPARAELDRISHGGRNGTRAGVSQDTYRRVRSSSARQLFDSVNANSRRLLSITPNVRTAAAYLRVMLDVKDGNVRQALGEYNNHGGAIQRAYPGKVADAYQDLFGSNLPSRL